MQPNRIIRAMASIAVGALLSACSWDLPGSFKVASVEVLEPVEVGELLPSYAFFVPLDEPPFRDVYEQLAKKSNIAAPLYDYKANPGDLCFQIRGGDMVGRTYASAPIPIKHGEILDAVARRKMQ